MKYSRQNKILGNLPKKTVCIVGCGALGSVSSQLLARAGINLILFDPDIIEENNLHRQINFTSKDVGKSKVKVTKEFLEKINPDIKVTSYMKNFDNADCDLILDCSDNAKTRHHINSLNKPWIFASAIKSHGYVCFNPGINLEKILPEDIQDTCESVGVISTITTMIASLQTHLTLMYLSGKKVDNNLRYVNLDTLQIKKFSF